MWRCRAGGGAEKLGKGRNKSDRRKEGRQGKYARRAATMRIYEGYIEYEEQIFIKSNQYCIRNYNLYLSLNPAGRVLRISSKYYTICDHLSSPPILSSILHRTICMACAIHRGILSTLSYPCRIISPDSFGGNKISNASWVAQS